MKSQAHAWLNQSMVRGVYHEEVMNHLISSKQGNTNLTTGLPRDVQPFSLAHNPFLAQGSSIGQEVCTRGDWSLGSSKSTTVLRSDICRNYIATFHFWSCAVAVNLHGLLAWMVSKHRSLAHNPFLAQYNSIGKKANKWGLKVRV